MLLTLVALLAVGAPASSADPGGGGRVEYDPPVDAPITDPFRPPPEPWLPGNRGVEMATVPGTPVAAAADGEVAFAGQVGGTLHVTVVHADGVRTSYSYLEAVLVRAGQQVRRGDPVGRAGARLHVGARRGATYIDPVALWSDEGPPWVRLVPLAEGRRPLRGRGASRLVGRGGRGPRLVRRPWHQVRADHTSQPGPPTVAAMRRQDRVTPNRWERRRRGSARRDDEAAPRGGCPLRAPDPPLEPEDAAVHPR